MRLCMHFMSIKLRHSIQKNAHNAHKLCEQLTSCMLHCQLGYGHSDSVEGFPGKLNFLSGLSRSKTFLRPRKKFSFQT